MFEPPVDGVYAFTMYAIFAGNQGPIFIKNNEDILCQAYVDGTDNDTATCSAIAELTVGDSVRVTGENYDTARIRARDSGFTGHLVK